MYFGGNNHGCQEYSKNVYKYTQADRLTALYIGLVASRQDTDCQTYIAALYHTFITNHIDANSVLINK